LLALRLKRELWPRGPAPRRVDHAARWYEGRGLGEGKGKGGELTRDGVSRRHDGSGGDWDHDAQCASVLVIAAYSGSLPWRRLYAIEWPRAQLKARRAADTARGTTSLPLPCASALPVPWKPPFQFPSARRCTCPCRATVPRRLLRDSFEIQHGQGSMPSTRARIIAALGGAFRTMSSVGATNRSRVGPYCAAYFHMAPDCTYVAPGLDWPMLPSLFQCGI
jgi:hypothetical protein